MSGMTLDEAVAHVCDTNPVFKVGEATIRGVDYRVFDNVPSHLADLLHAAKSMHGDGADDYLSYQDDRWTYDEFCRDVNTLGHALQTAGLGKGDRIGIAMRNFPELLLIMMANASIGAVTVFLNAWWTTEELDYALEDSGAQTVFTDAPRLQRLLPIVREKNVRLIGVRDGEADAPESISALMASTSNTTRPVAEIDTDDDFAIMYSSGTTGHPKGVVQTHRGAISAVYTWLMTFLYIPLMHDPNDPPPPEPGPPVIMVVTPLFHVTATHPMFLLSLPMGARLVLQHKWDAEEAVRLINRENVTRFLGVPTQSAELMQAAIRMGDDLKTLEYIGSGGAKRPAAQVAELDETFPRATVASGWGMTETNAVGLGIAGPDYSERPGSAGRLLPPLQDLKILDDDGNEIINGEVGELTVKSPANMRCYLNKPEATKEVFEDGWLKTGDLATLDDQGYVTIVDRKKNIIIRGGENIACLDVEGALHRHPAIMEAGVFAVPDDRLGEVVGAGIQLRAGMTVHEEELGSFLAKHIAKYKIPDHYWFRQHELPRGATDKTDRRALRDECLATMNA